MQQLGLEREDEYYERLRGEASRIVEAELRNLLNLVTVTETCFFRDASQFRLLREHIIPRLIADRSPGFASGVPGCSSGEEAYSIALTLEDMGLYRAHPNSMFEIVGTDLNSTALEKARRGEYSARAVRNVEGRLLDRFFTSSGRNFMLNEEVRNRVKFEFGNLTQTPMPSTGPQDVILCKNVVDLFRYRCGGKTRSGLARYARARRISASRSRRVVVADAGRVRGRRASNGPSVTEKVPGSGFMVESPVRRSRDPR